MSTQRTDGKETRAQHRDMLAARDAGRLSLLRLRQDPLSIALAAVLLFLLLALAVASFWLHSITHVFPSVESMGVSLGGRSRKGATDALERAWREHVVVLEDGGQAWSAPAMDIGLRLNTGRTVDAALSVGDPVAHLRYLLSGVPVVHLLPAVSVERAVAEARLRVLASEVAVAPVDASLRVVGARVQEVPSVPGRALDVAATAAWLSDHVLEVAEGTPVSLVLYSIPALVPDLAALVQEANAQLEHDLAIRAYDPITGESSWWTVDPEAWTAWLTVDLGSGSPPELRWSVDREQVRAYVAGRVDELGQSRYIAEDEVVEDTAAAILSRGFQVAFRVYHRPGQHVVQAGETLSSIAGDYGFPYPWLQSANPGVDGLRSGQTIAIPSPDVLLPLPVVWHKRIVISISQQRMWAYDWGNEVWAWTVSTGIASSPTSPGVFQVQSHERNAYASSWDLWMPYFLGIYRPVPSSGFMNGFHGFPTRDGSNLLWTGNLGYPVTYGCILLSTQNAALLFDWAEEGVVVEIRP